MKGFWRALPTEGRWLLSTVAIQTLGRGLTLPFTIIYLHEVRGFDLGLSGALMSLIAIAGLIVTGPGGTLIDRYGARADPARRARRDDRRLHPARVRDPPRGRGRRARADRRELRRLVARVQRAHRRGRRRRPAAAVLRRQLRARQPRASASAASSAGSTSTSTRPETFTVIFLVDAATQPHPDGAAARAAAARPHASPSRPTTRRRPAATARSSGSRRCCG